MKRSTFRFSFLFVAMAGLLAGVAGCEASTQADAKAATSAPRVTVKFRSQPESGVRVVAEGERNCVTPCDLQVGKGESVGFFYGSTSLPVSMGPWTEGQTYTIVVDGEAATPAPTATASATATTPPATEPPPKAVTPKLTVMWWGPRGLVRLGDGATVDVPVDNARTILVLHPANPAADSVAATAPLTTEVLDNRVHVVFDARDLDSKELTAGRKWSGLQFRTMGQDFHFNVVLVPSQSKVASK